MPEVEIGNQRHRGAAFHRRRGPQSLLVVILALIVLLVVPTAGVIGITTYVQMLREINDLSHSSMTGEALEASAKTSDFLQKPEPVLALNSALLLEDPDYGISPAAPPTGDQVAARQRLFLQVLRAHPEFTMVHYGDSSGDFAGARREADGELRVYHRWQGGSIFHHLIQRVLPSGKWEPLNISEGAFDPRVRPWYLSASGTSKVICTYPYPFATAHQHGITAALRIMKDGRLAGVAAVDFEMQDLVRLVQRLDTGTEDHTFLLTRKARSFDPNSKKAPEQSDPSQMYVVTSAGVKESAGGILPATAAMNDRLAAAAAHLFNQDPTSARGEIQEFGFSGLPYLGVSHPFELNHLHWMVVVVIPKEKVVGPLVRNSLLILFWCIAILVLALCGALPLARSISAPLHEYAREIEKLRRLDIIPSPLLLSPIYEVQRIGEGLELAKTSLRSFARYVPSDVVRSIVHTGQEPTLGGETAVITVLFADIVGFTTVSEQLTPAEVVDALAAYLREAEAAIREAGGIVDKYIGDAVMAFWGSPIQQGDRPEHRACAAALKFLQRSDALREEQERNGRVTFTVDIGIHTGEALVGNIGSRERMNYTAMGDSVNVAQRVETLNRTYHTRILITESTRQAVEHDFNIRPVDQVAIKGRHGTVSVFELKENVGVSDTAGKSTSVPINLTPTPLLSKEMG